MKSLKIWLLAGGFLAGAHSRAAELNWTQMSAGTIFKLKINWIIPANQEAASLGSLSSDGHTASCVLEWGSSQIKNYDRTLSAGREFVTTGKYRDYLVSRDGISYTYLFEVKLVGAEDPLWIGCNLSYYVQKYYDGQHGVSYTYSKPFYLNLEQSREALTQKQFFAHLSKHFVIEKPKPVEF